MSTAPNTRNHHAPEDPPTGGVDGHQPRSRRSPLAWVVLGFIWLYRSTAPMRSPRCRFYPSCSSYGVEAVKVHGAIRGGWLAIRRLGRCHPWNLGGVDHVPPRK